MATLKNGIGANLELLIDSHIAVWLAGDDPRLVLSAREIIVHPATRLLLSAVTAWEITDLVHRGRLASVVHLETFLELFGVAVLPLPADVWRVVAALPDIHRDPVDRMLISHALISDLPLMTADEAMRRYPVRTLW